jgi:hypothetical protein
LPASPPDREDADRHDAILQAAREIRAAVRRRRMAASEALADYDGAIGDRLEQAIAFLRAIKECDQDYAAARSSALERYAARVRATRGRQ